MDLLTWSAADVIARDRRQAYLDGTASWRLVRSAQPGRRPGWDGSAERFRQVLGAASV
jgi:hypothetical protein